MAHNLVSKKCKDNKFGITNFVLCQSNKLASFLLIFQTNKQNSLKIEKYDEPLPKNMAFWPFIEEKQMEMEHTVRKKIWIHSIARNYLLLREM